MSDQRHQRHQRPSRAATQLVGGHFPRAVAKQLRMMAAEDETTMQALIGEALDLLFEKHGKARVAELKQPDGDGAAA